MQEPSDASCEFEGFKYKIGRFDKLNKWMLGEWHRIKDDKVIRRKCLGKKTVRRRKNKDALLACIISALDEKPMTPMQIKEMLGVSESLARNMIRTLKDTGIIIGNHYVLNKD